MCQSGSHVLVLRNKETGAPSISPFRCNSWRCPKCQRFKGAQDFVRVRDAMLKLGDHWVYLVLTFDPSRSGDQWETYEAGYSRWKKLSKRLIRAHGPLAYIQTWEAHKSGYPHVNVVVHNENIWNACKGEGWRNFRQALMPVLVKCGFGYVVQVTPLRSDTGISMSGYLTKTSRELTGSGVKNQVPVNAPPKFRRLRSSRGLLEPIHRPGTSEGLLLPAKLTRAQHFLPDNWVELQKARLVEREAASARKKLTAIRRKEARNEI